MEKPFEDNKAPNIDSLPTHFLYPAAIFAPNKAYKINTILGSCISICLYDRNLKTGGINHYMLPLWNGQGLPSPKYGNIAIEKLLQKMLDFGSRKVNLQAKVFGGGEVIESSSGGVFQIGARNIEIAHEILNDLKIPIISKSTGGKLGRKIIFRTDTGEVLQRFIKRKNENNF